MVESWSRKSFYLLSLLLLSGVALASYFWIHAAWSLVLLLPLVLVGIGDSLQTRHTILRNFPLLGRLRYMLESLRPEIRQYFIESDAEEIPISREKRSLVFQRAKGEVDTLPFGTKRDVYQAGYEWIPHSMVPKKPGPDASRVRIGEGSCQVPYDASLLNVAAMSYGALSHTAVRALNEGAALGEFAHNTGEGGISSYHLEAGGDLIWQIGTGYFGCRNAEGDFDEEAFARNATRPSVKLIELKLSQGAKPAHGGLLPAAKVSAEIASIRGVPLGQDVHSPAGHRAFSTPQGLLEFLGKLRHLSGGKPVGIKLCIGRVDEWFALAQAMAETGSVPDFIAVDGSEGGTGAAPLEFTNFVGMPSTDGLVLVHDTLRGIGLRSQVRVIVAGKIASGFHMLRSIALGADACYAARAMMFAIGCIQALKCNTNRCPTGVATTDKDLAAGLVVEQKSVRVASFHRKTIESFLDLLGAAGLEYPSDLRREHVLRRVDIARYESLEALFPTVEEGAFLRGALPPHLLPAWERAPRAWSATRPMAA